MSKKFNSELLLAYSTIALAVFTAVMAYFTYELAAESKEASFRQIGVQTWLEFEKRFDSADMSQARKKLATQLKTIPPARYEEISQQVPEFFEDLGTAYRLGYIDKKLADSSFSIYVTRYWEALRSDTQAERLRYGGDNSINQNFEYIAKVMLQPGEKIDQNQLQAFLTDESHFNGE